MKHILVVVDDMMNLVLIKDVLSQQYQVSSVTSGEKAISRLEEERPDLILMDIDMPDMDGREVAVIIKEDARWKEIPIVFLTADSDPKTEEKCLELGADDFIIKPFVPLVMKKRIGRILELNDLKKALEMQLTEKKNSVNGFDQVEETDVLTGLYTGRYLENRISALAKEDNKGIMVIMNVSGSISEPAASDSMHKMFAQILKENTRRMDVVGRMNDDEFIIFFMDMTDRKIAAEKAGIITRTFKKNLYETYDKQDVAVSVKIAYCPEEGNNFDALYASADNVFKM